MADTVVLRQFSSRADAEIVRELLLANGIESFIVSDDCGAMGPSLQFTSGAQVVVAAEDEAGAEAAIAAGVAGGPLLDTDEPF